MRFAHQNPKEKSKTDVTTKLMKSKKLILEEVQILKETLEHYESPETSEELKQEE